MSFVCVFFLDTSHFELVDQISEWRVKEKMYLIPPPTAENKGFEKKNQQYKTVYSLKHDIFIGVAPVVTISIIVMFLLYCNTDVIKISTRR